MHGRVVQMASSITIPIVRFHTGKSVETYRGDGLTQHPVNIFIIQQSKKGYVVLVLFYEKLINDEKVDS